MNREIAKTILTQLRKELDKNYVEHEAMRQAFFAGEISADIATSKDIEFKNNRATLQKEFNQINALPCCNI